MVCLPESRGLSISLFAAPLLLVRGLGRRAARWLVINHQRQLQKLSVRRRHRQSLSQNVRPCSEPLVSRTPHDHDCKIRPWSEPVTCAQLGHSSAPGTSPAATNGGNFPAGRELDVHIYGIHVPVEPLVACSHVPQDPCGSPCQDCGRSQPQSRASFLRLPLVFDRCSSQGCQDAVALLSHTCSGWTLFYCTCI